jgi:hypothetical protein
MLMGCTNYSQNDSGIKRSSKTVSDSLEQEQNISRGQEFETSIIYLDTIDFFSKIFSLNSNNDGIFLLNKNRCVAEYNLSKREWSDTCKFSTFTDEEILAFYNKPSVKAYTYGFDTDFLSKIILPTNDTLEGGELIITDLSKDKILFNELEFVESSAKAIIFDISSRDFDTLPFRGLAYFHPVSDKYFVVQYNNEGMGELYLTQENTLEKVLTFEVPTNFVGYSDVNDEIYLFSSSKIFLVKERNTLKEVYSGQIISAIYNKQTHSLLGIELDESIEKYKIFEVKL